MAFKSATLGGKSVRSNASAFVSEASFYRLLKAHDLLTGRHATGGRSAVYNVNG